MCMCCRNVYLSHMGGGIWGYFLPVMRLHFACKINKILAIKCMRMIEEHTSCNRSEGVPTSIHQPISTAISLSFPYSLDWQRKWG